MQVWFCHYYFALQTEHIRHWTNTHDQVNTQDQVNYLQLSMHPNFTIITLQPKSLSFSLWLLYISTKIWAVYSISRDICMNLWQ